MKWNTLFTYWNSTVPESPPSLHPPPVFFLFFFAHFSIVFVQWNVINYALRWREIQFETLHANIHSRKWTRKYIECWEACQKISIPLNHYGQRQVQFQFRENTWLYYEAIRFFATFEPPRGQDYTGLIAKRLYFLPMLGSTAQKSTWTRMKNFAPCSLDLRNSPTAEWNEFSATYVWRRISRGQLRKKIQKRVWTNSNSVGSPNLDQGQGRRSKQEGQTSQDCVAGSCCRRWTEGRN